MRPLPYLADVLLYIWSQFYSQVCKKKLRNHKGLKKMGSFSTVTQKITAARHRV